MSIEQALIAEVRSLTPQQQQEVLNFAAFLRSQHSPIATHPPVPGLHKDIPYWMAEDFDAPLPDSFWLGENETTA
ncbi:MAG: hypothetical protein DCF25_21800 [Leptolyngbya foveolarum]|uniref:DUF2281 domain-containing protein n=1 Tax=Leptolyngbya foveolarum TaxID=47253 RepID=A0A2W4TNZ2_9CYAN|nr:MAG: hypothetical protein DCF25_21800 [Leptolyngbya foveolarum]